MPVPVAITDLSSTAAGNSPAGSDPISTNLDDFLRAIQAIVRAESLNKGWERYNHAVTWLSSTTFSVPTDLTALYRVGRRLKSTLAGPTTAYHTITNSAFGGGVTTITVSNDSTALSSPISEIQLGLDVLALLSGGTTLFDGVRGTTQAVSDSSTLLATTAFVQALMAIQPLQLPARQTVLSGPVDSNGHPNFGGSTTSTTVTCTGSTLVVTAANGSATAGGVNRVGSITSPSWTGLSTNGTMYLYLDIAADGTCTTGSTTLAPVYQWGGTYSTSSGQFTFNIQEMTGKVGNGSAATQTYRVFVGEVTVSGGVVTAITWYAIQGRYRSTANTLVFTTPYSASHNIGVANCRLRVSLTNISTELNYAVGDEVDITSANTPGVSSGSTSWATSKQAGFIFGGVGLCDKTTGVPTNITAAKWKWNIYVERGF